MNDSTQICLFISVFSAVSSITTLILVTQVLNYDRDSNRNLMSWMKHQEEINKIISTRQNQISKTLRKVAEIVDKM